MTLSILAFDEREQVVGAAVTSCVLAAGRRVLHVRPGIGAVAAQAGSEITWGTEILDQLEAGCPVDDAVDPFRKGDVQVAAITFKGEVAVHTGTSCVAHAADASRRGLSVQVNTAALADATTRMVAAFDAIPNEPLAERLVAALAASGDDARGKQSAAILVTGVGPLTGYAHEPHVDLRVDEHRDPVGELTRLLSVHRAHCAMRLAFENDNPDLLTLIESLVVQHPSDPHLTRALAAVRQRALKK